MANKNSVYNGYSRYVHGGMTEVGTNRLEWWERSEFRQDESDKVYIVENFYEGRLDNLASTFYNEPRLWWFLAQYNNILDPVSEIMAGRVLLIPTKERMERMLQGRKGGYNSQRDLIPTVPPVVV